MRGAAKGVSNSARRAVPPRLVFAAADRRRPRVVAGVVMVGALAIALFVVPLAAAWWSAPGAPEVHLPAIERFDKPRVEASQLDSRGGGPDRFLPAVALLGTVVVAGAFAMDRWRGRREWRPVAASTSGREFGPPSGDRRARRTARQTRLPGRWWPGLLALVLATITVALVAQHYTGGPIVEDDHVDDGLVALGPDTGSILEIGRHAVRSAHRRPKIVALTFDDGPDPRWTPQILDVLAREHVPATFFVVGQHVVDNPDLARRILGQGGEIGVHTYRHRETTMQSRSELERDLRLTQLAIIGATGRGTALFRPPFITDRSNVGLHQYGALAIAAEDGYLTVLADQDSTDWSRPGVAVIALRAMPVAGGGGIIELHDGGGDRSQTVAALPLLIRALRSSGYQFETVSSMAQLSAARVMPERDGIVYTWGRAFVAAMRMSETIAKWFVVLVIAFAAMSLARLTLVLVGAVRHRRRDRSTLMDADLPPVSVIIAAYNEEDSITATLRSLSATSSDSLQIVVVDDGSTDQTARVVAAFPDSRIVLVPLEHGGKAQALAEGLARCAAEIVVTVDADTRLDPAALRALVGPLADDRVGGVSGNLRVSDPQGVLGVTQQLEYMIGNAFDRRALDLIATQVTIPGAAGAYRRSALDSVGGFDDATLAEDTDMTLALVAAGWQVRFAPDALALTSTPQTLRALWRQRSRWSFGIAQAVWQRRSMVAHPRLRPRAAATWLFAFVSQVLLPLMAPLFDVAAIWALTAGARTPVVVWLGFGVAQLGAAAIALRIEGQSLRWLRAYPLHLVGYRQLTACVVVQTVVWAAAGRIPSWGSGRRTRSLIRNRDGARARAGQPDVAHSEAA